MTCLSRGKIAPTYPSNLQPGGAKWTWRDQSNSSRTAMDAPNFMLHRAAMQ